MKKVSITIIAILGLATAAMQAAACEADHWVSSVANDGAIVTLDDGSVWQIDAGDTVDTALWTAMDDVVACDDKLVNTDEGETAGAHELH